MAEETQEDKAAALKLANRRRDGMFCAAYLMIAWLVWIVVFKPDVNQFAQSVVNIVLGMFLRELGGMYSFETGTTRGNAAKDATITDLTKTAAVTADTAKTLAGAAGIPITIPSVTPDLAGAHDGIIPAAEATKPKDKP